MGMSDKTDKERLVELLNDFGVEFDEEEAGRDIVLRAKKHEKVQGYTGFAAVWTFDRDGKFRGVGIWE
jgi:hypothetical protein